MACSSAISATFVKSWGTMNVFLLMDRFWCKVKIK
jgi:hypothetical protein